MGVPGAISDIVSKCSGDQDRRALSVRARSYQRSGKRGKAERLTVPSCRLRAAFGTRRRIKNGSWLAEPSWCSPSAAMSFAKNLPFGRQTLRDPCSPSLWRSCRFAILRMNASIDWIGNSLANILSTDVWPIGSPPHRSFRSPFPDFEGSARSRKCRLRSRHDSPGRGPFQRRYSHLGPLRPSSTARFASTLRCKT